MKVLPYWFQQYLSLMNPLTHQSYSGRGAFGNLSNHISQSQKLPKYLSYEADLFLKNALNFM